MGDDKGSSLRGGQASYSKMGALKPWLPLGVLEGRLYYQEDLDIVIQNGGCVEVVSLFCFTEGSLR